MDGCRPETSGFRHQQNRLRWLSGENCDDLRNGCIKIPMDYHSECANTQGHERVRLGSLMHAIRHAEADYAMTDPLLDRRWLRTLHGAILVSAN